MRTYIHREFLIKKLYSNFIYRSFQPLLGIITLLNMLPVLFYSCDKAAENNIPEQFVRMTKVTMQQGASNVRVLDIFVFRDDRLQKLDCYQRFDSMEDWKGAVVSGSGDRIITALANCPYGREEWTALNSRAFMKKVSVMLEDESRDSPQMYGEISVNASNERSGKEELILHPFASEVILNSISCDFTGKAYAGERLTGIRVYLTNVNAECHILEEEGSLPCRIINAGRLREEDLAGFKDRGLIVRELEGDVGEEKVYPDISLWCYRSNHPTESPGTPYTRLVIEGKVGDRTYYWPINVNRSSDGEIGIWRNCRYIYDIRITCKGSTDPDIPVDAGILTINQKVTKWEEKKDYAVAF